MHRLIRRTWSGSLAGQMVGLLLSALLLSQCITFLIYRDERAHALSGVVKEEFFSRAVSIVHLLESTPPSVHDQVLRAASTTYGRYWLTAQEPGDSLAWQHQAWSHLAEDLPASAPAHQHKKPAPEREDAGKEPLDVSSAFSMAASAASPDVAWQIIPAAAWSLARPAKFMRLDDAYGMGLSVRLASGTWFNAAFAKPMSSSWSTQSYVSLGITALAVSLIALVMARRVGRPLRSLALAAEQLGRGEQVTPLCECGPQDIRQTAEAFNRMQSRLRKFIEDRTRMLAALGHDLRTPITALRLRAEFIADVAAREKLLVTLDEMQAMTEAALAFAREEATGEPRRTVDLAALLESLCDDLADLGWDVAFTGGERTPYRCRPEALRRAVRNLIENAMRYGERARVGIACSEAAVDITVEDDGPGIAEVDFERVFAPFIRLESSRNRETGGVGLGLSIARAVVRGHGGDILLANRSMGGLRATIRLPPV
ncbi:MAG TPA: ATP-binding protein [Dongiaceae bacterium]|nr:ATP-binding protein [Dongiaceae bacterium]